MSHRPASSRPPLADQVVPPTPALRLRGPGDLVEAVPFLLGFHPHDSLVVVGLSDQRVVLSARIDLADLSARAWSLAPPAALELARVLGRQQVPALVAIAYRDGGEAPAATTPDKSSVSAVLTDEDLYDLAESIAALADSELLDALVIERGTWRSLLCRDPTCCPEAGQRLATGASVTAADATVAGMMALGSRQDVVDSLAPLDAALRLGIVDSLEAEWDRRGQSEADLAARRRSDVRALFAAARRSDGSGRADPARLPPLAVGTGPELPGHQVVRFGAALRDARVRDSIWFALEDGRLAGSGLWLQLARRLPDPWAAAPWLLYGWLCWRGGDGVRAAVAADNAVRSDDDYSAAHLLDAAVRNGLDPMRTPRLRPQRTA